MAQLTDADLTCQIGREKADDDQLQLMVRNTLRKLSQPMNKNCLSAWCVQSKHTLQALKHTLSDFQPTLYCYYYGNICERTTINLSLS